ncbi:MAG TPA: ABC transporter permease [Vicinamibacterales bacterium]|nr:ABC transporter permease [Vicinamibacterales bacterium]
MTRLGDAFYRFILLAFPARFRRRHGDAMVTQFRAQRRAVRGRPVAAATLWARALVDAARHGLTARVDGPFRGLRGVSGPDRFAPADVLAQDVRNGLRSLARSRGFVALSVLCLGLALGVNLTAFVFVNGILLRPVPLDAPGTLISLHEIRHGEQESDRPVSDRNYLSWKDGIRPDVEIGAGRGATFRLSGDGQTHRYAGALVSWDLFAVLGVGPAIGRGFLESEDRPGGIPVVVLSHSLWTDRYGQDPGVIGRTVTIDGTVRTVIGVMPESLLHPGVPSVLRGARLWIPLGPADEGRSSDDRRLSVYGRLGREALTLEAVRARLEVLGSSRSAAAIGNEEWRAAVQPVRLTPSPTTRAMLWLMMGAVTAVLLVACANVANLSLARAIGRRRELATRTALGASERRLTGQLLCESLLVAGPSVLLGLVLAYWGRGLLLGREAGPELYVLTAFDGRVLGYAGVLALATAVAAGLLPALRVLRGIRDCHLPLVSGRGVGLDPRHARLGSALSIGQVAVSVVLLVGASLFGQSFRNLLGAEGGFDTSPILTVRVDLGSGESGPAAGERDRFARQVDALVERLRSLPGVTHVAAANFLPLKNGGGRTAVVRDGPAPGAEPDAVVLLGGVTGEFFEVLGVPVLQGRAFTDADVRLGAAVAVVNARMARRLWPGENAVGRRFRPAAGGAGPWFTVVGVSADILTWDVSNRPLPAAYLPYSHAPVPEPGLFLRTSGTPNLVAPAIRAAVHDIDPGLPVLGVRTMTDVHYSALSRNRTLALLLAWVSAFALVLGTLGVYGVLSNRVSQRTHEIGIRAALGADRARLIRQFVAQGMVIVAIGSSIGLMGAVGLARVVRGRLYEVSPADPWTLAGVTVLLVATGLLATYVPARRAAAVDPLTVMREW